MTDNNTEVKKDHVTTALDTLAEVCNLERAGDISRADMRTSAAAAILNHYREMARINKPPAQVSNFYYQQSPPPGSVVPQTATGTDS